jgi:RNA polymerase sigma-54 factor
MKQSLQLKIGQHLTMTPQLQQAIRLLQLSSLDLHQEIQEALYSNPLLEAYEEDHIEPQQSNSQSEQPQREDADKTPKEEKDLNSQDQWSDEASSDLSIDTDWNNASTPLSAGQNSKNSKNTGESGDLDSFQSPSNNLLDHLEWQLNLTHLSDIDRHIGTTIIDAIGGDGFLTLPIEEIWDGIRDEFADSDTDIELDEAVAVLHRIQNFDPSGVAAHDLRECVLIQLNQLPDNTAFLTETKQLVDKFLSKLAERDFKYIERKTNFTQTTLKAVLELIQTLSPKPGELFEADETEYVVPDVRVFKTANRWQVSLNKEITLNLRINNTYAQMIRRADNSKENQFLRDNLQDARTFLRSLEARNDTLLRVSSAIVETQKEFLEHGDEAMKPLILANIAEQLALHESTISRVTTQKFIDTPQGVYELKHFFSSYVSTTEGGQCSSTAIRAMIRKIIDKEDTNKPLSDNKLALMLDEVGIKVARRTVAKYREGLNIPSSSERKRYKHTQ